MRGQESISVNRATALLILAAGTLLNSCKRAHTVATQPQPAANPSSTVSRSSQIIQPVPGHIRLRMLPAIAEGVAALPRVVPNESVTPEQAARLNAVFDRYDRQSRNAIRDCKATVRDEHREVEGEVYTNNISVLMRGPRYLSILVEESYDDCGGPHPADDRTSLVYDVNTGKRLNLLEVLPGSYHSDPTDPVDADGAVWPPLQKAAQKQAQETARKDPDPDDDCRSVYEQKDMAFVVWLDAEAGSINGYPAGLSHIVSATCGEEVAIDLPTARSLGVSPDLLSQLAIAHTAAQQTAAAKTTAAKQHFRRTDPGACRAPRASS